jgi:tRNA 2-selenouridine synthase
LRLPTFASETVLAGSPRIIDLRSPGEFARDHLPGAVSVPLFDDEQRAIVGMLYKQESPEAAYEAGLEMVEAGMDERIERILCRELPGTEWKSRFRELAGNLRQQMSEPSLLLQREDSLAVLGAEPIILHCWRGGMRSQSMALLLRSLGETQIGLLEGGYKAYRAQIMADLAGFVPEDFPFTVLRGATGVGKTQILCQLEERAPHSTLDLEGLAGHRSSVLGAVGLKPVSQPRFETLLLQRLAELGVHPRSTSGSAPPRPVFVEGESRKVGNVILPESLYSAMQQGGQLKIEASVEYRVNLLGLDYLGPAALEGAADPTRLAELATALNGLTRKLGGEQVKQMQAELRSGRWKGVTEQLFHLHYDALYAHGEVERSYAAEFDAEDPELLVKLLAFRAAACPPAPEPR